LLCARAFAARALRMYARCCAVCWFCLRALPLARRCWTSCSARLPPGRHIWLYALVLRRCARARMGACLAVFSSRLPRFVACRASSFFLPASFCAALTRIALLTPRSAAAWFCWTRIAPPSHWFAGFLSAAFAYPRLRSAALPHRTQQRLACAQRAGLGSPAFCLPPLSCLTAFYLGFLRSACLPPFLPDFARGTRRWFAVLPAVVFCTCLPHRRIFCLPLNRLPLSPRVISCLVLPRSGWIADSCRLRALPRADNHLTSIYGSAGTLRFWVRYWVHLPGTTDRQTWSLIRMDVLRLAVSSPATGAAISWVAVSGGQVAPLPPFAVACLGARVSGLGFCLPACLRFVSLHLMLPLVRYASSLPGFHHGLRSLPLFCLAAPYCGACLPGTPPCCRSACLLSADFLLLRRRICCWMRCCLRSPLTYLTCLPPAVTFCLPGFATSAVSLPYLAAL